MTPEQILMANALARAGLFPGSNAKRFSRDMQALADHKPDTPLTPAQHKYLCDLVVRHRRTISPPAVAVAQALATQGPPAPAEAQA